MSWKISRSNTLLLIFAVLGLTFSVVFFQSLFPESALRVPLKKNEVIQEGQNFVETLGYDVSSIPAQIEIRSDGDQIRFLNRKVGLARTNQLIQDSIPAFYWRLQWRLEEPDSLSLSLSTGSDNGDMNDHPPGTLELHLTTDGQPFFMEYHMESDDFMVDYTPAQMSYSLQYAAARDLAGSILTQFHDLWMTTEKSDTLTYPAVDREFIWERLQPIAHERVRFKVKLAGDKITGFQKEYVVPALPSLERKQQGIYDGVGFVIKYIFVVILALYYFITRLRRDALDLKSGWIAGLIVLACWAAVFWAQISGEQGWQIFLGFLVTTPFVAGGIWIMFALGEAVAREVWSGKLATVDGLRQKLLFPALGRSLFHGLAAGAILLGAYASLATLSVHLGHGYFYFDDSSLNHWTAPVPSLHWLGKSLMTAIYLMTTYCLFFQSWVRERVKKQWLYFVILFLFWSLLPMPVPGIRPFGISGLQNAMLGILVAFFFARYDYIAVIVGLLCQSLLYYGLASLIIGGFLTLHAILIFIVLLLLAVLAILANRGVVLSSEIAEYVPDYMQRVYERERIQRELEIARNIQINLLPRSNPKIEGLDVASLCVPAKEVGGDYFDFITLGPKKLGVVIGDVSGKGIPAAFYMTLTKGLLKSQVQLQQSPRDVLINMNTLFYENAERGIFISMIYAVFDLENGKLITARAGHNPMMLLRSGTPLTEEICPKGIALGFEPGKVFEQTIEEIVLDLEKEDIFLFYTDGLNEAQNQFHREFGEERLKRVVQECGAETSEKIVQCIRNEIAQFTGDAPQHDDMTAVVVRVMNI
jgi:serine phosphatase RsbU (regulator of sigma subunit)